MAQSCDISCFQDKSKVQPTNTNNKSRHDQKAIAIQKTFRKLELFESDQCSK